MIITEYRRTLEYARLLVRMHYIWPVDAVACYLNGNLITKEQYDEAFEESLNTGDN